MLTKQYAGPVAIATAVVVYVGFFVLLLGSGPAVQLFVPAGFALAAALGVWLLAGRTRAEHASASVDLARQQVEETTRLLDATVAAAKHVRSPELRARVADARRQVPALLQRVEDTQPADLLRSVAVFRPHVEGLREAVTRFATIEADPTYFADGAQQLADGLAAVQQFNDFTAEATRLVNQRALPAYRAHLKSATSSGLPELKGQG